MIVQELQYRQPELALTWIRQMLLIRKFSMARGGGLPGL